MKTPKILKWRIDGCPPVSNEFFNIDNVVELSAWAYEANSVMQESLIFVPVIDSEKTLSSSVRERIINLLNDREDEQD